MGAIHLRVSRRHGRLIRLFVILVLALLHSQPSIAQDIIPPKQYVTTPSGLNLSDASLELSTTDLAVGTLSLNRFLRAGKDQSSNAMFGKNFSSNLEIYVAKVLHPTGMTDSLIVHVGSTASGTYWLYHDTGHITGANGDSLRGILTNVSGKYVYTDSSGTVYTFSATVAEATPYTWGSSGIAYKIERIDFPDGRVQTFSYNASNKLKLVEDTAGYAIVLDYNASNDVSAACGFVRAQTYVSASTTCTGAQLKTSYTYVPASPKELLTTVTDVLGNVTTYTNTTMGVTCVKPPGSATCTFTITNWQVIDSTHNSFHATQTMADGGVWSVSGFDDSQNPPGNREDVATEYNGSREVSWSDPNGKGAIDTFTKSSPAGLVDLNGNITSFHFDGGATWITGGTWYGSRLLEATYPEGDKYQAEYNGPFSVVSKETRVPKPGSVEANLGKELVKEYGYQSCTVSPGTYQNCAKPIWIKDPKGNRTDFYYEPHGGIRYEMDPAPAAGAARPLKMTTWTQRSAWIWSGGTLIQAMPVWVKATETQCQAVPGSIPSPTTTCDPAQQQTTTTYEYGAPGTGEALLVKGIAVTADGTTLRTCFSYDVWHRKISETKPNANANLAACP